MAKWQNDSMLDAALNYIENNVTKLTMCTSSSGAGPTTYALATNDPSTSSGFMLGSNACTSASIGAIASDSSGRKVAVAQQSSVAVSTAGNITHIALVDDSSSALLAVTTVTTKAVSASDTVTVNAWDINAQDAT